MYKSADPGRRAQHCISCSIQNLVQNPKSEIQNPKSEIQNPKSEIQNPKSEIQNPKSKIQNPKSKIRNPKSKICTKSYITLQNPKSEIQNPKSKIQNPKSKIPRQNPKFGALGGSHKELLHNDPKSKIPKIRPKKFGFWIGEFWILDSRFWILDSGFWILGGSRGCTTRQFSDGAWRSEARIPLGPPTVSDRVGGRKKTRQGRWEKEGAESSIVEPEPYVWAIYVSSLAAVGRNKGYNQLYLIQLGEARKLGNRNERRREGKRWATLPPTVSDTVGFGYLSNVFFCGLLAPSPGNLPGSAATGASLF